MRRILFLTALLAACSGGVKSSSSLSLSARAGSRVVSGATAAALPAGITLARVRIALRKIELRTRAGDRRAEIAVGPVVLDLAGKDLDGGVHRVLDTSVPAGTYDKIEFEIRRLENAADAAGAEDLVNQHASILIEGKFDDKPFSFASGIEAEQEREGTFTVGEKTANITLDIDPSGWFVKDGARLDPSKPENRAAIEANLRASIDAFQDDERVGHENHEGDDGEHDGGDDDGEHDGGDDHGEHDGGDDHGEHDGGHDDGGGHR